MNNSTLKLPLSFFRGALLIGSSIPLLLVSQESLSYDFHATACTQQTINSAHYDFHGIKNNEFWDYYICPILRRETQSNSLNSVTMNFTVNTGSFVGCNIYATSPLSGSVETSPAKNISGVVGSSVNSQLQWNINELPLATNAMSTYSTNCVLGGAGITLLNSLTIIE